MKLCFPFKSFRLLGSSYRLRLFKTIFILSFFHHFHGICHLFEPFVYHLLIFVVDSCLSMPTPLPLCVCAFLLCGIYFISREYLHFYGHGTKSRTQNLMICVMFSFSRKKIRTERKATDTELDIEYSAVAR